MRKEKKIEDFQRADEKSFSNRFWVRMYFCLDKTKKLKILNIFFLFWETMYQNYPASFVKYGEMPKMPRFKT